MPIADETFKELEERILKARAALPEHARTDAQNSTIIALMGQWVLALRLAAGFEGDTIPRETLSAILDDRVRVACESMDLIERNIWREHFKGAQVAGERPH